MYGREAKGWGELLIFLPTNLTLETEPLKSRPRFVLVIMAELLLMEVSGRGTFSILSSSFGLEFTRIVLSWKVIFFFSFWKFGQILLSHFYAVEAWHTAIMLWKLFRDFPPTYRQRTGQGFVSFYFLSKNFPRNPRNTRSPSLSQWSVTVPAAF